VKILTKILEKDRFNNKAYRNHELDLKVTFKNFQFFNELKVWEVTAKGSKNDLLWDPEMHEERERTEKMITYKHLGKPENT